MIFGEVVEYHEKKSSPNLRFLGQPGYFGPGSTQKSKILREFFSWYSTTSPKIIPIGDGHVR